MAAPVLVRQCAPREWTWLHCGRPLTACRSAQRSAVPPEHARGGLAGALDAQLDDLWRRQRGPGELEHALAVMTAGPGASPRDRAQLAAVDQQHARLHEVVAEIGAVGVQHDAEFPLAARPDRLGRDLD